MLVHARLMGAIMPTFDSPKVAKPRLPSPFPAVVVDTAGHFFVLSGDFLNDRLVTFLAAVGPMVIRKW
jgi:hypothetical protein